MYTFSKFKNDKHTEKKKAPIYKEMFRGTSMSIK